MSTNVDPVDLKESIRRARTPRRKVDAMLALAASLFPDDAAAVLEICGEAMSIARRARYRSGTAGCLKQEGRCHVVMGRFSEAIDAFAAALEEYRFCDDPAGMALVIALSADVHALRGEFQSALELVDGALKLAEQAGDPTARGTALHVAGVIRLHQGSFQDAVPFLTEALTIRRAIGEPNAIIATLNSLCVAEKNLGDYVAAINLAEELMVLCFESGRKRYIGGCHTNLGTIYSDIGDYRKALECFLEAVAIAEEVSAPNSHAIALLNVAGIYRSLGEFDQSLANYERALEILTAIGNRQLVGRSLGNMATVYGEMGDSQREREYLLESSRIATELGAIEDMMLAEEHLGRNLEHAGDHRAAREHYLRSLELAESGKRRQSPIVLLLLAGRASLKMDELDTAIEYFERAIESAGDVGVEEYLHELRHLLAQAYQRRRKPGDEAIALEHFAASVELREKAVGIEKRKEMMALQVRYDVERITREKERLAMELDHQSKELAAMAVHLAEKNEIIENVRRQVSQAMKALSGTARPLLKSLLMDLEANGISDSGWREFEEQFKLVHSDFLARLSARWPTLTRTELKVCALLKLGLSTKEIAGFLRVTPRAVDKHRNSIRRKMGLEPVASLGAFLERS